MNPEARCRAARPCSREQIARPLSGRHPAAAFSFLFAALTGGGHALLTRLARVMVSRCCGQQAADFHRGDRSAVVDTVRRIVAGVFVAASRRDAAGYVSVYAVDPDVHPAVWNGVAAPTLERLRATADSFYGAIAALETRPSGEVRTIVLAPDAAAAEVPFTFTITTKSGRRVPGQGVTTVVLRKRAARGRSCTRTSRSSISTRPWSRCSASAVDHAAACRSGHPNTHERPRHGAGVESGP